MNFKMWWTCGLNRDPTPRHHTHTHTHLATAGLFGLFCLYQCCWTHCWSHRLKSLQGKLLLHLLENEAVTWCLTQVFTACLADWTSAQVEYFWKSDRNYRKVIILPPCDTILAHLSLPSPMGGYGNIAHVSPFAAFCNIVCRAAHYIGSHFLLLYCNCRKA